MEDDVYNVDTILREEGERRDQVSHLNIENIIGQCKTSSTMQGKKGLCSMKSPEDDVPTSQVTVSKLPKGFCTVSYLVL